jgi:hypothetical protein
MVYWSPRSHLDPLEAGSRTMTGLRYHYKSPVTACIVVDLMSNVMQWQKLSTVCVASTVFFSVDYLRVDVKLLAAPH